MKIIIFGLGSIGKRHAAVLKSDGHELVAFRSGRQAAGNSLGIPEITSWREVERWGAEAAFITNPTALHIKTAIPCAKLGMHLFIEKPLSHNMEGIDELKGICRTQGLVCYTAYCLRFHPVILKLKELLAGLGDPAGGEVLHARVCCTSYLPQWRPNTDFRQSYSSSASLGGGVMLDLSHELDYVTHLLGPIRSIQGVCGRASDLTVDAEDFADLLLALERGVPVNMHLNFLSRINERRITIDLRDGYLTGDLLSGRVTCVTAHEKRQYDCPIDMDAVYRDQIAYFLGHLRDPSLMNNISEARALVEKIVLFKDGIKESARAESNTLSRGIGHEDHAMPHERIITEPLYHRRA